MWQQIIVLLIVAAAVLHFCTKYLPAAMRKQIVDFLARRGFDQNKVAKLFNTKAGCGDGCSTCGSCDDDKAPAASTSDSSTAPLKRVIKLHVQR